VWGAHFSWILSATPSTRLTVQAIARLGIEPPQSPWYTKVSRHTEGASKEMR
jgi:hypothetical protein